MLIRKLNINSIYKKLPTMIRQLNLDKEMRTRANSKPIKGSSLTSGKKMSPVIMQNKVPKLGTGSTRVETPSSSKKSIFTVNNNTPTSQ